MASTDTSVKAKTAARKQVKPASKVPSKAPVAAVAAKKPAAAKVSAKRTGAAKVAGAKLVAAKPVAPAQTATSAKGRQSKVAASPSKEGTSTAKTATTPVAASAAKLAKAAATAKVAAKPLTSKTKAVSVASRQLAVAAKPQGPASAKTPTIAAAKPRLAKTSAAKKVPASRVVKASATKPASVPAEPVKAKPVKATPSQAVKPVAAKKAAVKVAASPAAAVKKTPLAKQVAAEVTDLPDSVRPDYWDEACRYLIKKDRILRKIIPKYTGMGLQSQGDAFSTLARSIVSQQISTSAAAAVWSRFEQSVQGPLTAAKVLALEPAQLRACGLSARKTEYLHDLALHVQQGRLNVTAWQQAEDEEIIAELTAVRGIGRWTAEMFLMFHLLRPNVLPLDDLGLIQGISRNYFSDEPVSRSDAREVAEAWKPWRSVATWYMWRSLAEPQSY